jgi:hypothetical protein
MKIKLLILCICLIFSSHILSFGQILSDSTTREFINSLLVKRNNLDKFVLPEELSLSERLGISYKDIDKKYLISNDIDSAARDEIIKNKFAFTYSIEKLPENFSLLKVNIPKMDLTREYFFKDFFLVSKPYYYSRNWKTITSQYFIFHISDSSLFNMYSVDKLDDFVTKMATVLNFNEEQVEKLGKNKIHYFLCTDDDEIKQLTGYSARGLYYIPYDYIITTYNCHYHELLHLLINYKLRNLYLYTLPFLQEGFAVAFGGRGGKEPGVILNMGLFLAKSGMLNYSSLLNKDDFYQNDITMSYPVSGLYNKFLIDKTGIEKYLNLYRKYSTIEYKINSLSIDTSELPSEKEWKNFVNTYSDSSIIISQFNRSEYKPVKCNHYSYKISTNNEFYLFEIKDSLFLSSKDALKEYNSNLFHELFPVKNYTGEKYAIIADSNEISVYNFYSNNLIAKYVRGFTVAQQPVKSENGFYNFLLLKKLFDEPIEELKIN